MLSSKYKARHANEPADRHPCIGRKRETPSQAPSRTTALLKTAQDEAGPINRAQYNSDVNFSHS